MIKAQSKFVKIHAQTTYVCKTAAIKTTGIAYVCKEKKVRKGNTYKAQKNEGELINQICNNRISGNEKTLPDLYLEAFNI